MLKIQKGFTLIELLVVIAIIGILAGILFVAIDPASKITDANEAKMKASLQGVPTAATMVYAKNNVYSYLTVCSDATDGIDASGVSTLPNYKCNASAGAWAVEGKLVLDTGDYYCIDSLGKGVTTNVASIGALFVCP